MTYRKGKPLSGNQASPEERELFRRVVAEVRPLAVDATAPPRRKPPATARFARGDEREVLRESLAADLGQAESENGDGLRYRHPSIGRKTFRRLARGAFSVQAELDLHGLTAAGAHAALSEFLDECRQIGRAHV